ncbi:hypothetical protein BDY21DRAFT_49049 [Lineolata rhizophorae]|uniref:FAD/NAD(P)-binding domain-containing protein n=1 Tax=Lineolata rhizophorae TaxID=578093 RepID=A0A6A6NXU1_9PEZI|nr:hypothetical protein BDY21DRAFT_49049 [Lineolata rhizophorae]
MSASGVSSQHKTDQVFNILVVGCSYGGLATVVNLLDLCNREVSRFSIYAALPESPVQRAIATRITIVDERDGFYHVIGSPLALLARDYASKAWVRFQDIPALQTPRVRFLHGSVVSVDCESKSVSIIDCQTKQEFDEGYDYLVVASGLKRVWPSVPQSLTKDDYLSETGEHIDSVTCATRHGVAIIGGGGVGVEMAAELKLVHPNIAVKLIHSRNKLMSSEPLPDGFKDRVCSVLQEAGIEVLLDKRVTDTEAVDDDRSDKLFRISLADGSRIVVSHVITAISRSVPTTWYLPDAALDSNGYVKICPSYEFGFSQVICIVLIMSSISRLRFSSDVPNAKYHFAVGDIVAWSGIKRCGAAMHMGHYAARNMHQQMLSELATGINGSLTPTVVELEETPPMIGVALGKKAVCYDPAEGTTVGEDLMAALFGDDLGFGICWGYMQLGQMP